MPKPDNQLNDLATEQWDRLEQHVQRFELAWQRAARPALKDYLPASAEDRHLVLFELVHVDLEYRLKAGEPVRVENYLQHFPELANDQAVVIDLLRSEYEFRQRHEPSLGPEEYLRRFPQYRREIDRRWLDSEASSAPTLRESKNDAGSAESPDLQRLFAMFSPPQAPDEIGRLSSYRLLKVIGVGGMGVVFLAEDMQLRRTVAIKTLRPGAAANANAVRRFLREAQAAAAVKHDHIITVYQVGEDRGLPFIAMELLEGESLEARLQRGTSLPIQEALRIANQIALGLAAAHARGLIHRDMKPGNVWLESRSARSDSPSWRVKILDFGLARIHGRQTRLTALGDVMGTPAYMAPEQAQGMQASARSDLFSVGCILYRMLTGRLPFPGKDLVSILQAITSTHPPAVHELNPKTPLTLSVLVQRLLAKQPKERPSSAHEVADALVAIERILTPEAQNLHAIVLQLKRAAREYRRPLIVAAAVILLIIVLATQKYRITGPAASSQAKVQNTSEKKSVAQPPVDGLEAVLGNARLKHFARVNSVVYSQDGSRLASASADGTVRIWDASNGQQQFVGRKHDRGVSCVAFNPTGTRIASSGTDSEVRVWGANSGKDEVVMEGSTSWTAIAFNPDGQRLAGANVDGSVRIWDVATGKVLHTLGKQLLPLRCLAFSADGAQIAAGGDDQSVIVWDAANQAEIATFTKHQSAVTCLAFSPDGKSIAVGTAQGPAIIWQLATKQELLSIPGVGLNGIAFSPDGSRLAMAMNNATLTVWNVASNSRVFSRREICTGKVMTVAFSPDGKRVASGGEDDRVHICDAATGEEAIVADDHAQAVVGVAANPVADQLASISFDRLIMWDLRERKHLFSYRLGEFKQRYNCRLGLSFSPDGRLLVAPVGDKLAAAWDTKSRKQLFTLKGSNGDVLGVHFHPDGRSLASHGAEKGIRLWNANGDPGAILEGHASLVACLAFSPDGQFLASGGKDGDVKLWDLKTKKVTRSFTMGSPLQTISFTADATRLVATAAYRNTKVFEVGTGNELPLLTERSLSAVASFSSENQWLAIADGNGLLSLYSSHTWKKDRFWQLPGPVFGLAFTGNDQRLITGDGNGLLHVFLIPHN